LKAALFFTKNKRWSLPIICALAFVSSSVSAGVDVTDLGTLGGEQSIAFAVNESDQVVGLSWTTNGSSHSFLYSNGEMIDLYPLNSQDLITAGPTSINNLGQVASGAISSDGVYYPVVYDSRTGELATQGSLGGVTSNGFSGVATAINNFGQAVGYSYLDGVNRHAFIYQKGTLRDLGCLQGDDGPCTTYAFGVNDQGQVVGSSGRAFLYSNGVMTDISPFGSLASYARGINNQGQVVGEYLIADHSSFHAFVYTGGTFTDIGSADSPETVAYDINDRGQVVGATWVSRGDSCRDCNEYEPHAFVYENGVMTELNSLLPPNSEWKLLQAFAINNKGRIVGYGLIHGQFHAFMLSLPRFQRANDMAERSNDGRAHSSSTPDLDPARLPDRKRIETLLGKQFILEMRGDSRIPLD
jgi:probable HAF family extracellular repeat protein